MKKRLNGIKYFVEKEIFSYNFVYLRLINIVTTCFIYCTVFHSKIIHSRWIKQENLELEQIQF